MKCFLCSMSQEQDVETALSVCSYRILKELVHTYVIMTMSLETAGIPY